MSLQTTPQGERVHIGIFGRTNTGKSSLINALTNQDVSIVSPIKGTTTDPVQKAMELLPLGPVVFIDTPGLDDQTALGQERIKRTHLVLKKTDIVVLVAEAGQAPDQQETAFLETVQQAGLPVIIALNKTDVETPPEETWQSVAERFGAELLPVSAAEKTGLEEFKERLASLKPNKRQQVLVQDLVSPGQVCVLVTPIDSAAPKGRLILPQQQVIRDLLDGGAYALTVQNTEYETALNSLKDKPALVVTDSQVFAYVSRHTPEDIPLTSFSILFARYKGDLQTLAEGARVANHLQDGDRVLICEGCTHHRQCDDIGTVKIPQWLEGFTGRKLKFSFTSGTGFPEDLTPYKLIVHCGGCMLNEREMTRRLAQARETGKPMVNYGVLIAHINGILQRCLAPFEQTTDEG